MVYQIAASDFRQIVTRSIPPAHLYRLHAGDTLQILHEDRIGRFQMAQTFLPQGTITDLEADFVNIIRLQGITDPSHISLHFHLQGSSDARIEGFHKKIAFSGGYHNLFYCHDPVGSFEFPEQKDFRYFVVSLNPEFVTTRIEGSEEILGNLMQRIIKGESCLASKKHLPVLPQMMQVIHQLRNCYFSGATRQLYLESKILELLALQLQHCQEEATHTQQSVLSKERAVFYDVKAYLEAHYLEPQSLYSIARSFGLNEFRLKKGFKKIFGYTVFGYLLEIRLQEARQLLESHGQTIDEVAAHIGYSSPAHFSTAYKKRFGLSPGKYQKEYRNS